MTKKELKINEKSIRTDLNKFKNSPDHCLFEYIWNSFDAGSTEVRLEFKLPENGLGLVSNVKVIDNGNGWNFDDHATTNNFKSSIKIHTSNKTIPRGKLGRGRYAFIWISEKLNAFSRNKKLTLQGNTEIDITDLKLVEVGTQINFDRINEIFSNYLKNENLEKDLVAAFGWFLIQNKSYKILINGREISVDSLIQDQKNYTNESLPKELQEKLNCSINTRIVIWKDKPKEYSKFYFLDESGCEIYKENTGLNKKNDNYWHSIYIKSSFKFPHINEETGLFDNKNSRDIKKEVIDFFKREVIQLRKPYLVKNAVVMLKELKSKKIIPNLKQYGIFDEDSYDELLKNIYTISPSFFVKKSDNEKKFLCATFAGLLSSQDDLIIKKILEQLYELTEVEKEDLLDILNRTSLSNVVKTIKEVDHRIDLIDKLQALTQSYKKDTKEVEHLQKILDDNFWVFGEQFRLFSSTEGRLNQVLQKYAKEILEEDVQTETKYKGEVDLFLTKTEYSESLQKNIIVELKRPSITLGKKEYDQIYRYQETVLLEPICNSKNQYWEFYLIGNDYNNYINDLMENAKNHGEINRGLIHSVKDGHIKIYVRKWSDILEVEWGAKLKYLKNELQIKSKPNRNSPQKITDEILIQNN